MPDQQPAATENTPIVPNDADTAVAVSAGQDSGMGPGGGGLGGAGSVPGRGESGTAPNAPIDVPTPNADRAGDDATGSPRATADVAIGADETTDGVDGGF